MPKSNFFKKVNLEKKVLKINFNWAYILAFVAFWAYSFYSITSFFIFPFISSFIPFLFLSKRNEFFDTLTIKIGDIFSFVSYLPLMLLLSMHELTEPLIGDEIYHFEFSQEHSRLWAAHLVSTNDFLSRIPIEYITYGFNIMLLLLGVSVFLIARKLKFNHRLIFLVVIYAVTLVFRKYSGPHPPFRLFPLWISSIIFSPSSVSLRLPQFITLILSMVGIQRFTVNKLGLLNSWLLGLTIGTIPILWRVGVLVEPSVWSSVLFTFLSLAILFKTNEVNYIRWLCIISVASLMRHSAFVAFIPIGLLICFDLYKKNEYKNYKKILLYTTPALLMLPFMTKCLIIGTPATYNEVATSIVPAQTTLIKRIILSITSGAAIVSILHSINIIWLPFAMLSFIPLKMKELLGKPILMIFFILLFTMFYSIQPGLWGIGRYQAEYVIPFIVTGFVYTLFRISMRQNFIRGLIITVSLILLTLFNIFTFNKAPQVRNHNKQIPWGPVSY